MRAHKRRNRIPAGLIAEANETEFFEHNGELKTIYRGVVWGFDNMPECRKKIMLSQLEKDREIHPYLEMMVGSDKEKQLEQYILCRNGGMDDEPDIDANGNIGPAEYYDCPDRGACTFEGKVCRNIMVEDGVFLTKMETQILLRIELPNKQIAAELFIAEETVKTHLQNIRTKVKAEDKLALAVWAVANGFI